MDVHKLQHILNQVGEAEDVGYRFNNERLTLLWVRHGRMPWISQFSGRVPVDFVEKHYGVPLSQVKTHITNKFEIAFTVTMPRKYAPGGGGDPNRLQLCGMSSGVPANRYWLTELARLLGQYMIVITFDMLCMGESSMIADYGVAEGLTNNEAFDWSNDIPYIHQLMTQVVPRLLGRSTDAKWIFIAFDWAGAFIPHYAAQHPEHLQLGVPVSPIAMAHPVVEIVPISHLHQLRNDDDKFMDKAMALPQAMIGIEKYMVNDRSFFNHYTERLYFGTYFDTNYQNGLDAIERMPSFWNIACLAARASRLNPLQLLPRNEHNPRGVDVDAIHTPLYYVFGSKDQMMSPQQRHRMTYMFYNAKVSSALIKGADHFIEITHPEELADMVLDKLKEHYGPKFLPVYLGARRDEIYKGDELQLTRDLTEFYDAPSL